VELTISGFERVRPESGHTGAGGVTTTGFAAAPEVDMTKGDLVTGNRLLCVSIKIMRK
jgi:hypothetical protein